MIHRFLNSVRRSLPRRFVVADRSMEPTLVDGQGVIGLRTRHAAAGQLRVFEHPERPNFWMIKRVTAVSDSSLSASMIVESDNDAITTVDSNTFGPVDVSGSYRVIVRVPQRFV